MGRDIQMNRPVLVIQPDAILLRNTGDLPVVLKIRSISETAEAFHLGGNRVHTMHVEVKGNLADMPVREDWKEIPVTLYIDKLGSFTELAPKLDFFRNSRTTLFLPSCEKENYVSLQILASLGIPCGLYLKEKIDWEAFNNLLHYSLYPKVPHAPVEPFEYIASSYKPEGTVDFDYVYFTDNTSFYQPEQPESPDIIENTVDEKRRTKASALRKFMQQNQKCASCKAWRICLGKMKPFDPAGKECAEVMSELLDTVAEKYNVKYLQGCRQ